MAFSQNVWFHGLSAGWDTRTLFHMFCTSRLACFYEPSAKKTFNWGFLNLSFGCVYDLNREPKMWIKWHGFHLFVLLKLLRRLKPFTTHFTGAIFGFVVLLLVRFQLTGVSKSPITDITRIRPPLHVYRHVSLRMTCLTDKINPHHDVKIH